MDVHENKNTEISNVSIKTNESDIDTTSSAVNRDVKILEYNLMGFETSNKNDTTTKCDNESVKDLIKRNQVMNESIAETIPLVTDVDLNNKIESKESNINKSIQCIDHYSMDSEVNEIRPECLAAETESSSAHVSHSNKCVDNIQILSSMTTDAIQSDLTKKNIVNTNSLTTSSKSNLKINQENKTSFSSGIAKSDKNVNESPENLPSCSKDSFPIVEKNSTDNAKNVSTSNIKAYSNQEGNENTCIQLCKNEDYLQNIQMNDIDSNPNSLTTNTQIAESDGITPSIVKRGNSYVPQDLYHKVKLYAEDMGPKLYPLKGNIVTPPIITKNLPEAFQFLPVHGMPKNSAELDQFHNLKIREYVGCDLSDDEFNKVADFCSPEHLKTGNELKLMSRFPTQEPLPDQTVNALESNGVGDTLCLIKKLKLRLEKDSRHLYTKKLKYRGIRILPFPQNDDFKISFSPLEPGKDLIFRVRVYRPFYCSGRERHNTRHSVFSNDIVLLGRQKLTALRDRLICSNDVGMRVDVSENPEDQPSASAKDVFPSGFLFINNAFYVDTRGRCEDHSVPVRQWAVKRKIGVFPRYDMAQISIDQLLLKLGHPEVYVHQGNCEHLFTFSEVRLLSATDPLKQSSYPFHTAISQNQTIYCTTCAEFGAKWIVTGCSRVPFDPAFFCESCFKLYLYKDGMKICDFKAYSYRGNELNLLKPAA